MPLEENPASFCKGNLVHPDISTKGPLRNIKPLPKRTPIANRKLNEGTIEETPAFSAEDTFVVACCLLFVGVCQTALDGLEGTAGVGHPVPYSGALHPVLYFRCPTHS